MVEMYINPLTLPFNALMWSLRLKGKRISMAGGKITSIIKSISNPMNIILVCII